MDARFPVIQAGMGLLIGNSTLAAASIKAGGFGVVSTVGLGIQGDAVADFAAYENEQIRLEIRRARALLGGQRNLGVNIMVAMSNYEEVVRTAVDEGIDFIVSGAGLPTKLPLLVGDADLGLVPVISSGRALKVVLKSWVGRYQRKPDAVVVEGPRCGGHLGFSYAELEVPETRSLEILHDETRQVLADFDCAEVPLLAAGEVATRADVEAMLKIGYNGVQIGTKFITTEESGIDRRSKEYFAAATDDQVVIIQSPVGLPVRVLRSPLVQRIETGAREKFVCKFQCLRTCDPSKVSFCIAKALLATAHGDIDNGLFMTGCKASSMGEIYPIADFFRTLE